MVRAPRALLLNSFAAELLALDRRTCYLLIAMMARSRLSRTSLKLVDNTKVTTLRAALSASSMLRAIH